MQDGPVCCLCRQVLSLLCMADVQHIQINTGDRIHVIPQLTSIALLRLCSLSPVRYVLLWREPKCFLTCTWSWCPHIPSCSGGHSGFWWPEQNEPSESHRSPILCWSPCLCFSHTLPCIWPARGQHFSTSIKNPVQRNLQIFCKHFSQPVFTCTHIACKVSLGFSCEDRERVQTQLEALFPLFLPVALVHFLWKEVKSDWFTWFDLIGKLRTRWKDTSTLLMPLVFVFFLLNFKAVQSLFLSQRPSVLNWIN